MVYDITDEDSFQKVAMISSERTAESRVPKSTLFPIQCTTFDQGPIGKRGAIRNTASGEKNIISKMSYIEMSRCIIMENGFF